MGRKPNILLVLTDQQALRTMRAYGNKHIHTPHMDSLADSGVAFRNSYCTSPVCSPARASLVTGRMPHEVGVDINDLPIRQGITTIGEVFRDADYVTVWSGKWHLPDSYPADSNAIPGFENLPVPRNPNLGLGTWADDPVAEAAIKFIRQEHTHPFLLTVSLHNPHDICHWVWTNEINRDVLLPFSEGAPLPPLPDNFPMDPDEPQFVQWCRQRDHYGQEIQRTKTWSRDEWRTYLHVYHRLVEHADARLGRILHALRESGLQEDTLVVFTSDHGEGMAGHHWAVKLMLYEEPVTVPLLLSWNGMIPAGMFDSTHLVSGIDLLPTLCDYACVTPPAGLPGISLRTVIETPELSGHDFVVAELQPDPDKMDLKGRMLRTRQYKYIAFSAGHHPEMLFDLEADSGETTNLARKSAHEDILRRHRALLSQWVKQSGDDFAVANNKRISS